MMGRHPNRQLLAEWLEGDRPELDGHLDTCERCADRLDELADDHSPMRDALEALLHPPSDLGASIRSRFDRRTRDRADLGVVADLFVLPLHVARAVSEDQPPPDDSDLSHA